MQPVPLFTLLSMPSAVYHMVTMERQVGGEERMLVLVMLCQFGGADNKALVPSTSMGTSRETGLAAATQVTRGWRKEQGQLPCRGCPHSKMSKLKQDCSM